MKRLIKKYDYYIPNRYKNIDTSRYEYDYFQFANKEWKIANIHLDKLELVEEEFISTDDLISNRELEASLAIENVYPDSTNDYEKYLFHLSMAREELFKLKSISKDDINRIYLLASNNEKLIDKNNIPLDGKSLFRTTDIYIGGVKVEYVSDELEKHVEELCDLINKDISEDNIFLAALKLHFLFEHLHPLPDYNGRIGRLLLLWCLSKGYIISNLSNYINNNKDEYYSSIELTEKHRDITYSLIFLINTIIINKEFDNKYVNANTTLSNSFDSLNRHGKQALFNLYTRRAKFAIKEYKNYFHDSRSTRQIQNILSNLEKSGLVKTVTSTSGLKRYFYEEE